ncbi:hypothetical protein Cob_v010346 [Colletotrichum orbiculare MAFF 240422]|uniref:Uncharacterized protein n=1 Tax=Colletotrichum orbiculare (strain 104-T / ATCC 96160 / CBS 514.97 / LARS 414 / MAFF 240422) TaxID=1213857 RepID=A0A484FE24_COLOR|nr:hypothetical protein Cob_v010346 [Colletotrichum orbiculare MAFF 240422]
MGRSHQTKELPLPSWYYRVSLLCDPYDLHFCSEVFDEDISDIESVKDASTDEGVLTAKCDYGCASKDGEHHADGEDSEDVTDSDDNVSERSYDGSDADEYYELKDLREDRKRELRVIAKERQGARDYESGKVEEVRAAYKSLKKAERESETLSMGFLAMKIFRLYSPDYVQHRWTRDSPPKIVEFISLASISGEERRSTSKSDRRLVTLHDGDDFTIKFVSDDHLIIRLSRDLVFKGCQASIPESAPEIFEFAGILLNRKKEREERLKWQKEEEERKIERQRQNTGATS